MRFKNVSPLGALDLPLAGRVVAAGEVVEVTEAQAAHLTGQADWQPVGDAVVGEAGAEPLELPRGARVTPLTGSGTEGTADAADQEDTPTRPRRRKTKEQEGETGDDSE